jgi:hypothetical protein
MNAEPANPLVFLGPSALADEVRAILPHAEIVPPITRDQLYQHRERRASMFLIIDGTFAHDLAVPPREIVDVLRDGALVYGASSMGALRAADCAPAGMRGIGLISRLYRMGCLDSDDEVAVATNPDRGFAAVSVALINVRYAAGRAIKRGLLDRSSASAVVAAARDMFFAERSWPGILRRAGVADTDGRVRSFCASTDLKRDDALRAARALASELHDDPELAARHARSGSSSRFVRLERYPGHDPALGLERDVLHRELAVWLFGSGRYQKYIWPVVAGEPEFDRIRHVDPMLRAEALRECLGEVLARICSAAGTFTARLVAELELLDEIDAEVMRWYSVRRLSFEARRRGLEAAPAVLERTRAEIAIAHGVCDWPMLVEEVRDERLFGAIPMQWIDTAVSDLALARALRHQFAAFPSMRSRT